MTIERFRDYLMSLLSDTGTPQKFFKRRYGAQSFNRQAREKRRSDLFDLSATVSTSQGYCDALAKDVGSLLSKNERRRIGNFYVGLSDEAFLSCTVEHAGNSFLIIIYRRLFNALTFFSDIYVSSTLSMEEKVIVLSEYIFAITSNSAFLDDMPIAPVVHSKNEAEEIALLKGNLIRFLIGHELYHVLPSLTEDFDTSPLPAEKKTIWENECQADYSSVTLMLREQAYASDILQRFRRTAIQAPVLFLAFLDTIERLRTTNNLDQSHPPASLRDITLSVNLKKNLPDLTDLLQYTHTIAQPLFEKIQDYISENMVYERPQG